MERKFKSTWEAIVAKALEKERIDYDYEPGFFQVRDQVKYTPDFVLNLLLNAKRIILEPHGIPDPVHFAKFTLFRKLRGSNFFLILIVKNEEIPRIPKDAYDDIWPIEFVSLLARKLKESANDARLKITSVSY
jgi:hypothetical protein